MKPMLVLFAAAAFGLPALASAETVFKWVDANGVTNYTTTPPPTSVRQVKTVYASSTMNNMTTGLEGGDSLYWRERRQRETANDIAEGRSRRENDDLRQQLLRQQLGAQYDDQLQRQAAAARQQAAFNQCMFESLTPGNCNPNGGTSASGYATPVVVASSRHALFNVPPTLALPGQPSLSTPTPGAPRIFPAPRPVVRPSLSARLGSVH